MNRIPVVSSNLRSVGYDQATRTLEIEFIKSGIYRFSGVPESVYVALMRADSHGSFFDHHIKDAGYPYQRIA